MDVSITKGSFQIGNLFLVILMTKNSIIISSSVSVETLFLTFLDPNVGGRTISSFSSSTEKKH